MQISSKNQFGEAKSVADQRLKETGRWDAFVRCRDEHRLAIKRDEPDLMSGELGRRARAAAFEDPQFAPDSEVQVRPIEEPLAARDAGPRTLRADSDRNYEDAERVAKRETPSDAILRLIEVAQQLSEPSGVQADVEWVYANRKIPWDQIDPATVPSVGAIGLLEAAISDPTWFYSTYHAKLLPTKAQIDRQGWFDDDTGKQAEMIQGVTAELEAGVA